MIAEISFLVPSEKGPDTVAELAEEAYRSQAGPPVATLEEKEEHYLLKSESEFVTKRIAAVFESGGPISWYGKGKKQGADYCTKPV